MLDEEEEAGGEGFDEGAPAAGYDYAALADAFDASASEGSGGGDSDSDASPGAPGQYNFHSCVESWLL
jgi:hypothetical protein